MHAGSGTPARRDLSTNLNTRLIPMLSLAIAGGDNAEALSAQKRVGHNNVKGLATPSPLQFSNTQS